MKKIDELLDYRKVSIAEKKAVNNNNNRKRKLKISKTHDKILKIFLYVFLIFYILISIYPFFWAIMAAFHKAEQISRLPLLPFLPDSIWTTKNFTSFFKLGITGDYGLYWLRTSLIYSVANATLNCFFNFLAGYALARIHFRGKRMAVWYMIVATLIPVQATQIPQLIILLKLGFIGSNASYFVFMAGVLSTGMTSTVLIFMVRQFYINQSASVEESGYIDGLSRFKIFFKISLRTMLPLLATQWALVFIGAWNNFIMFQLWSMGEPTFLNITGGLVFTSQTAQSAAGTGRLIAGTIYSTFPVIIVYIISLRFQRKTMIGGEK